MMIGRAKQAHHGIEDIKIVDLEAESARAWEHFLDQMRGWRIVLTSLAATVLLVGGVGVLSVMLISFSDRRYEIGLRKAMGASDGEILVQFLLEACVLAAVGASFGTFSGAASARPSSRTSPTASSSTRWALLSRGLRWCSRSSSACTRPSAPRASRRWRRCGKALAARRVLADPARAARAGSPRARANRPDSAVSPTRDADQRAIIPA